MTLGAAHLQPTPGQPILDRAPPLSHTIGESDSGAVFLLKDLFGTNSSAPRSLIVNN